MSFYPKTSHRLFVCFGRRNGFDLGDTLAPHNHATLTAEIVRHYVRPQVNWIFQQHSVFQTRYFIQQLSDDGETRDAFRHHEWFNGRVAFYENWDPVSIGLEYCIFGLEYFASMSRHL